MIKIVVDTSVPLYHLLLLFYAVSKDQNVNNITEFLLHGVE